MAFPDILGFGSWRSGIKLVMSFANPLNAVQACHLNKEDLDYLLELIYVNPDYFLDELLTLLQTNRFISIHHTTIHHELACLRVSQKKTQKDSYWTCQADFVVRMGMYSPEEIGFINKTSKNCWFIGHCYGRSMKNQLVFPGLVRSGHGVSSNPNRDRDWLAWVPELKKTGLNRD